MTPQELEAFLAVAEELHFGRAAERLHIAQPPLSRTIRQLEHDVGSALFQRTTRRVRLTSAGEALVEPARQVLESLRSARLAVQSAGRGEIGRVSLGFAGPASHLLVAALGRRVREAHPGIELNLRSTTYGPGALRAVIDGDLDLAIVRWAEAPRGVESRIVSEEHYVLVVPDDHRLVGRVLVSMADCRDEAFVALPGDPGSWVHDAFIRAANDAGFSPNIVQRAPESWTAMALVAAGVGITFSVDAAVQNVVQRGIAVVPLREGRQPTYSRLVWRANAENPALHAVVRASRDVLPTPSDLEAYED
jgi:DNA-binding transcriptional LysR family regulator